MGVTEEPSLLDIFERRRATKWKRFALFNCGVIDVTLALVILYSLDFRFPPRMLVRKTPSPPKPVSARLPGTGQRQPKQKGYSKFDVYLKKFHARLVGFEEKVKGNSKYSFELELKCLDNDHPFSKMKIKL